MLRPLLQIINIITLVVMIATLFEPIKLCLSVWFGPTAEQGTGIASCFHRRMLPSGEGCDGPSWLAFCWFSFPSWLRLQRFRTYQWCG
jgi:hypothetical protein